MPGIMPSMPMIAGDDDEHLRLAEELVHELLAEVLRRPTRA